MDTQELDDLNEDGDEVMDYRDKARAEPNQSPGRQTCPRGTWDRDIIVFFLITNFGEEGLLMFGTVVPDADDPTWERVSDIVSAILRQVAGLQ